MKGKITVGWLGKTAGGDGRLHVHCLSGMSEMSWGIRIRHGLSQAWLWGCPALPMERQEVTWSQWVTELQPQISLCMSPV